MNNMQKDLRRAVEKNEQITEEKEKEKKRREKLSTFFFTLAQITYTMLVMGAAVILFQDFNLTTKVVTMCITGVVIVVGLAKIGDNILK